MSSDKYIVFAHGLRLSDSDKANFQLDKDYRIITLHTPGKQIMENLVKIILNQIDKKMDMLNGLFTISCPIGRNRTRIEIENNFIKDYFRNIFKTNPIKANNEMMSLFDNYKYVSNLTQLNNILEIQNYEEIKKNLNFEIRTYRPGDFAPRLLLQFKMSKSLSMIPAGIFTKDTFKDFDFDDKSESLSIGSITNLFDDEKIESLVKFDLNKSYLFDDADVKNYSKSVSFFNTIKSKVPSGLIVVLSCGVFSGSHSSEQRSKSTERQRETKYRKYYINYE